MSSADYTFSELAARGDSEDRLVSCIAGKPFRVTSLYPMIESLAMWYDGVPHPDEPVEMLPETPRAMSGTVSMTGRLWTHRPSCRCSR